MDNQSSSQSRSEGIEEMPLKMRAQLQAGQPWEAINQEALA